MPDTVKPQDEALEKERLRGVRERIRFELSANDEGMRSACEEMRRITVTHAGEPSPLLPGEGS